MFSPVLTFWFDELEPKQWWQKDGEVDQKIIDRFSALHQRACLGELYLWRKTTAGRLAEIIILDQFSRNMFRESPRAFAQDAQALTLAQEAIAAGSEQSLNAVQRSFLYMPFMHSESLAIHAVAKELFERNGIGSNIEYEIKHQQVIEQFGRYPHRNAVLDRESSPEELTFLSQPGSRF